MNVKQLIEVLSKMDSELMVVVHGYEGGVNEVGSCNLCDIELNLNTAWYYGKHETLLNNDKPTNIDSTIVKGVILA